MPFSLDHLMSVTSDRVGAARALQRMGFSLTERGEHSGRGTSNHLIFFGHCHCYWEILCVDEPLPGNAILRELIKGGPGLVGCALRTSDILRDVDQLRSSGLLISPPQSITRPVTVAGTPQIARFRTAAIAPKSTLRARVFFCEHLTPEFVWTQGACVHPNGAIALKALHIVGSSIEAARTSVGDLLAQGNIKEPAIVAHGLNGYATAFEGAAAMPNDGLTRLCSLEIQVADIAKCHDRLVEQGVRFERRGAQIHAYAEEIGNQPVIFSA